MHGLAVCRCLVNRPLREWAEKEQDKENKLPTDEPPRKKTMMEPPPPPRFSGSGPERPSTHETASSSSAGASVKSEPMSVSTESETTSTVDTAAKAPSCVKWNVAEVCDFIRNIPGCASYADEFLMQEVDGEALLLIKPEHLVMALSMKLGPALKIVACIDALRPESERQPPAGHD